MKFITRTARYILFNHKINEEISEELKVEPADKKLRNNRYKESINISLCNGRLKCINKNFSKQVRLEICMDLQSLDL
jgi:hypothetical protein